MMADAARLQLPHDEEEQRPRSGSTSSCRGTAAAAAATRNRPRRGSLSPTPVSVPPTFNTHQKRYSVCLEVPSLHFGGGSPLRARPRSGSIPANVLLGLPNGENPFLSDEDAAIVRVREFSTSPKGRVIGKADAFKIISRSSQSVSSDRSGSGEIDGEAEADLDEFNRNRLRSNSLISTGSYVSDVESNSDVERIYKVAMLGAERVGRTALLQQFQTLDYVETYDTDDQDDCQTSVSVALDGEESELLFISPKSSNIGEQDSDWPVDAEVDAYVIVYSVTDKNTFQYATKTLYNLRKVAKKDCPIILVGNKIDLARRRSLSTEEAKDVACHYNCKFIETSAVLKMNADELLVGILKQIRLSETHQPDDFSTARKMSLRKSKSPVRTLAKEIIKKFSSKRRTSNAAKSCENLFVL